MSNNRFFVDKRGLITILDGPYSFSAAPSDEKRGAEIAIGNAKEYKGIRPDFAAPGVPTGFAWFMNVYASERDILDRHDPSYEYLLGEPQSESFSPDQLMEMGLIGAYRRESGSMKPTIG